MNAFITVCGWLVVVLMVTAGCALLVIVAADMCRRMLQRFEWAVDTKTRQEVGRSLDASGWWFSESPDASLIVRIIGSRLARGESIDADSMREQWRKARASKGEPDER
jgi:hypothetical protein